MPDFHLALQMSPLMLLLAAAGSAAVSWYVYRMTIPPVAPSIRLTLISLRAVGLWLLVLLIARPVFSVITRWSEPPVIALLIDNSRSMTIRDRNGSRRDQVAGVLNSPVIGELQAAGTVRAFRFDDAVLPLASAVPESLDFRGNATDLATAFAAVKKLAASVNIQGIVLVTDGVATTGANPVYDAEETGVPVFTIGIGDTSAHKDVLIHSVLLNEICYVGTTTPVRVQVRSNGYGGEQVEVTLTQNGSVRDRALLRLEAGSREYPVPLSLTPDREGMQGVTVNVSILPGELTEQNNRATVYTNALKSRMNLLLIAGGPSADVAFVRRTLERDKNVRLTTFIERANGQFYEGALSASALAEAECLLLVGYPGGASPAAAVLSIANTAVDGKPLLTIMSRTTDVRKLGAFDRVLPFTVPQPGTNELELFLVPSDAQLHHAMLRTEAPADVWSNLPPLFRLQAAFNPKSDALVLATARLNTAPLNEPMIVVRNAAGQKTASFLGYGWWRWNMMADPAGKAAAEGLLSNAVRWLTTREDQRRVKVRPATSLFRAQDPIEFTGQVYDESYLPVDDARIAVTVRRGSDQTLLTLASIENGQYLGSIPRLEEGEYSFEASVMRGEALLAEEKGSFTVGGTNAEYVDTRMNKALLRQLALRTGGKYYDAADVGSLARDIAGAPSFAPQARSAAAETELWHASWMLVLAVLCFGTEWFIRKRRGML